MIKKILFSLLILLSVLLFSACDSEEPKCTHESMATSQKLPSCTESGYICYICNNCGYSYVSERPDALGHTYEKKTVAPSCKNAGYTTYTCSCGDSYVSDYIDALEHNYTVSVLSEPTCEEHGYLEYRCQTCSDSYITPLFGDEMGHNFTETVVPSSCTDEGYTLYECTCGYSIKSDFQKPNGHSYTEDVISSISCTDEGMTKYTCECGDTYTLTLPPLGHSFTSTQTMPTLSDMGFTKHLCTECGFEYTGNFTFYTDILKDAYVDTAEPIAKGIDISYFNYKQDSSGNYLSLDWGAIKAAGISYVIIRIGDASIGLDPTFEKSYTEAKAAGLEVGAYFYTRAQSVDEITLEANLVLSALKDKQFEYPIYLDLEDDSLKGIDPAMLNEMCVTFFTTLQRSGYYTGLYVNNEWLYNVIDTKTATSRFELWYARYPSPLEGETPTWSAVETSKPFGMWQYTDSGIIEGIDHTEFDFNYAYKDYPTLIKEYGFNGFSTSFTFPDTEKSFVWVIYPNAINIRSKNDFFTTDGYDSSLDVIGYASYGTRFEVVEKNELYTAILYNGEIAYISSKSTYVSFTGLYTQ